jgi:hypothetical protein
VKMTDKFAKDHVQELLNLSHTCRIQYEHEQD